MGTILRKQATKPLPKGAELVTRDGRRHARWKVRGKTRTAPVMVPTSGNWAGQARITVTTAKWYAQYRDGAGVLQVVPTGCRDEGAARRVLADLERRAELVRAGVM